MTTRRAFLGHAVAGALGTVALGAAKSDTGVETLEIIDCHTHFYDPTRPQGVPWPGKGTPLYRTVLPDDLKRLPKPKPVTGTVIVEASKWVEDNQWLLDLAKDDPFIVGIVGHLTPGEPAFKDHLARFGKNDLYRGIRVRDKQVLELLEKDDLADLKRMADADLSLDVNGGPTGPYAVARLAERLPSLRIVINHIANVPITAEAPPSEWAEGLRKASKGPNVFCKVSALVEGASRGGRTAPRELAFYKPYLDVVWDAFGENRLIYGSNWPVSDRGAEYHVLEQLVLDDVAERGSEVAPKFFSQNAIRAYKWVERPGRSEAIVPKSA
ncbi:Amidohydrolase [Planctomycetes bacterium Pan216]|uniref:Amidohydrolase n=1 Tax=Kolteria novifilia TaxID=2527975 RepID=A0A518B071_9BACT|nr:Amidohydrolase [Planctomycetes bacterium Pan216]